MQMVNIVRMMYLLGFRKGKPKTGESSFYSKMSSSRVENHADGEHSEDDAPSRIRRGKQKTGESSFYSKMSSSRVENHADGEHSEDDASSRIRKGKQIKTRESSHVYCAICMDSKPDEEMFRNQYCSHIFCNDCIRRHVAAKIEDYISVVQCPHPSCKKVIEPHQCRSIIPEEVFVKWGNVICENLVPESEKFYCPFKDCSAMMISDANEVVTSSECPHCHRLFCAQCKVSWHAGVDCEEFQRLEKSKGEKGDSLMEKSKDRKGESLMVKLAKTKGWRRCPKCSFYVERIDGCSHISCRCGHRFCYDCGLYWNSNQHYFCRTKRKSKF